MKQITVDRDKLVDWVNRIRIEVDQTRCPNPAGDVHAGKVRDALGGIASEMETAAGPATQ